MSVYRKAWFDNAGAQGIWEMRYRAGSCESSIEDTWCRVALNLAGVEQDVARWALLFYEALCGFRFIPAGRILAGAGIRGEVTLVNCFVSDSPRPRIDAELDHLKQVARTLEFGGGVGCDFSNVSASGINAPAIDTYLRLWDAVAAMVEASGTRRGAMMATLRCDHPDIERFIESKNNLRDLTHFNLSVLITRAFMQAVHEHSRFPLLRTPGGDTVRTIDARQLFEHIAELAFEHGEPGVFFVDMINDENNLWYREKIGAANPCGEVPLPPHGACVLGSVNLTQLVKAPFTDMAQFEFDALRDVTALGVRMLDNVIDVTRFPLLEQKSYAKETRRLGVGVTGLGDALAMMGLHYGSPNSVQFTRRVMQTLRDAAYETSIELAREKDPFPALVATQFLESGFAQRLPESIRSGIRPYGIRNSHLLAVAPSGSISLLANNISSGIEPIFDTTCERTIKTLDGRGENVKLIDYAYGMWESMGSRDGLTTRFDTAQELCWQAHIEIQAAVQPYVDNAISKTVNLPPHANVHDAVDVFDLAYRRGLKGCTLFHTGGSRPSVLRPSLPDSGATY